MKLNRKKLLVVATVFPVALNINGCGVYGPPEHCEVETANAPVNIEQTVEKEHISLNIGNDNTVEIDELFATVIDKGNRQADSSGR